MRMKRNGWYPLCLVFALVALTGCGTDAEQKEIELLSNEIFEKIILGKTLLDEEKKSNLYTNYNFFIPYFLIHIFIKIKRILYKIGNNLYIYCIKKNTMIYFFNILCISIFLFRKEPQNVQNESRLSFRS